MAVNPFSLNRRVTFGYFKESTNENTGAPMSTFIKEFTRWGTVRSRTLKEITEIRGTFLENSLSVVVRYSTKITDQLAIKLGNQTYKIVNISFPNNRMFSDYIFLSVKRIDKVGE